MIWKLKVDIKTIVRLFGRDFGYAGIGYQDSLGLATLARPNVHRSIEPLVDTEKGDDGDAHS